MTDISSFQCVFSCTAVGSYEEMPTDLNLNVRVTPAFLKAQNMKVVQFIYWRICEYIGAFILDCCIILQNSVNFQNTIYYSLIFTDTTLYQSNKMRRRHIIFITLPGIARIIDVGSFTYHPRSFNQYFEYIFLLPRALQCYPVMYTPYWNSIAYQRIFLIICENLLHIWIPYTLFW